MRFIHSKFENAVVSLLWDYYNNPYYVDPRTNATNGPHESGGIIKRVVDECQIGERDLEAALKSATEAKDRRAVNIIWLLQSVEEETRQRVYDRYQQYRTRARYPFES